MNAVMHRDYSPAARGTQVQVELYPDRLVVRSPGGLYGTIDPAQFGALDVTSSRNAKLARLLSEVELPGTKEPVCENRGSGIPAIMAALRAAGMTPPDFDVTLSRVQVTVPKHALLDVETLTWLDGLRQPGLTDGQAMALAMMHAGRDVSNETLRGWGLHRTDATTALANLVQRGLVDRTGGRRYATYQLAADTQPAQPALEFSSAENRKRMADADDQALEVLRLIRRQTSVTTRWLQNELHLTYAVALRRVNGLIAAGMVEAGAPPTSRNRAYSLTASGEEALQRDR